MRRPLVNKRILVALGYSVATICVTVFFFNDVAAAGLMFVGTALWWFI